MSDKPNSDEAAAAAAWASRLSRMPNTNISPSDLANLPKPKLTGELELVIDSAGKVVNPEKVSLDDEIKATKAALEKAFQDDNITEWKRLRDKLNNLVVEKARQK